MINKRKARKQKIAKHIARMQEGKPKFLHNLIKTQTMNNIEVSRAKKQGKPKKA